MFVDEIIKPRCIFPYHFPYDGMASMVKEIKINIKGKIVSIGGDMHKRLHVVLIAEMKEY
jgi:hypothetical protein